MSSAILEELLDRGESERTEFTSGVNLDSIGSAVASFLNGEGGTLLVGVGERGEILGIPDPQETAQRLHRALADRLSPGAPYSVNVESLRDKPVIVIDVPPGTEAPYVYAGRIPVRRGPQTGYATAHEITHLIMGRHDIRWERQPALGADLSDLDREEILTTAKEVADRRLYDWSAPDHHGSILQDLNLMQDETVLNSAVVLFGRAPARLYPQTRVRLSRFAGDDRTEFVDNRILEGHAFFLLREVLGFLRSHVPIVSTLDHDGFQRTDRPAVPWAALREGVINALIHRDYAAFDGGASISVYPDRIEIWNSGRLPEGLTVADLKAGSVSRPQNPDMAHLFFLRGFIERLGIGARRIVTECREAGLPEPTWELPGGGVLLTLRLRPQAPPRTLQHLSRRQASLLEETAPGERFTSGEYHQRFAAGVSERQARQDLIELVNAGLLVRIGSGRSTFYERIGRQET
jgi:ATP-dependent DNA helicase RecG